MNDPHRSGVSIRIPVAWGDMDVYEHVNNVTYARWVESGRIAYFQRIGFLDRKRDHGVGPILARLSIDYRSPVTFPDTVRVEVSARKLGKSSFTLVHRIVSEAQQAEVASGEDVIVAFDYRRGCTTPLDEGLRARIAEVEGAARPRAEG